MAAGTASGATVVGGYKFRLTQPTNSVAPFHRTSAAAHHMTELLMQMHEAELFDSLRPYLSSEKIFYEHEDAATTHIRLDMLRALARKWKLHTQPGFWDTHNTRLTLARALRQHIRNKKEHPAQDARGDRNDHSNIHDSRSTLSENQTRAALEKFRNILPVQRTDVFRSYKDCSEAIVYLSRHARGRDEDGYPVGRFGTHLSSLLQALDTSVATSSSDESEDSDEGYDIEGRARVARAELEAHRQAILSQRQREVDEGAEDGEDDGAAKVAKMFGGDIAPARKLRRQSLTQSSAGLSIFSRAPFDAADAKPDSLTEHCARALHELSRHPGNRDRMIDEGALEALLDVLRVTDSEATVLDCANAIANLSVSTTLLSPHARDSATYGSQDYDSPLQPSLVRALGDLFSSFGGSEIRCLVVTALFNFSCNASNREIMVAEDGVATLLALAQPLAALARDDDAGLEDGDAEYVLPPEVAEDAFVLHLAVKSLCNLSTVPQGCIAIVDAGAIVLLRRLWQWLTPRLQASIGSDLIYNATRNRGYYGKVAESGATLVLANIVKRLHSSTSRLDVRVVRRCTIALCRLATLSSTPLLLEGGVGSLALAALATVHEQGGELMLARPDTPPQKGPAASGTGVPGTLVCRAVSAAMSRLLWRSDSNAGASTTGATDVVALLAASSDTETRTYSLVGLCNVFQSSDSAKAGLRLGALPALVASVGRCKDVDEQCLIAAALFNATCHEHVRSVITNKRKHQDHPGCSDVMPALLQLIHTAIRSMTTSPPREWDTPGVMPSGAPAPAVNAAPVRTVSFAVAAFRNLTGHKSAHGSVLRAGAVPVMLSLLEVTQPRQPSQGRSRRSRANLQVEAQAPYSLFPLETIADAIHVLASLSSVAKCRQELVAAGLLPILVPLAAGHDSSILTIARTQMLAGIKGLPKPPPQRKTQAQLHREALLEARRSQMRAKEESGSEAGGDGESDAGSQDSGPSDEAAAEVTSEAEQGEASAAALTSSASAYDMKPGINALYQSPSVLRHLEKRKAAAPPPTAAKIKKAAPAPAPSKRPKDSKAAKADAAAEQANDLTNLAPAAVSSEAASKATIRQLSRQRERVRAEKAAIWGKWHEARRQCAITLCNMACEPDTHARLLELGAMPAWIDLCQPSTEVEDTVRARVVEAFHLLSFDVGVAKQMVQAGVSPCVVALCSSNVEQIRQKCVGTLFNLSRVPGCEKELVEAGASKALMVVALLRSHQPTTQRMSMQAVHNLMSDREVRLEVLGQGVVFGLLKLAGANNPVTQRVCALTMYYLVHEEEPRQALIEGGCIKSIVRALQQMECFTQSNSLVSQFTLPHTAEHLRMSPPSSRSPTGTDISSQELVGNMLTGVLSTVCKFGGSTSLLIRSGVVKVLVTLCVYFRSRLAIGEADLADDVLEELLKKENGISGGIDPGLSDPAALMTGCVWGLYTLVETRRHTLRLLCVNQGLLALFVHFLRDKDLLLAPRQLALLGVATFVWSGYHEAQLEAVGMVQGVAKMLDVPVATTKYCAAAILHHASLKARYVPQLAEPSVVRQLLGIMARSPSDAATSAFEFEASVLAAIILSNISDRESVLAIIMGTSGDGEEPWFSHLCEVVIVACRAMGAAPDEPESVMANMCCALVDAVLVILGLCSRQLGKLVDLMNAHIVDALQEVLVAPGMVIQARCRAISILRNLTWDESSRIQVSHASVLVTSLVDIVRYPEQIPHKKRPKRRVVSPRAGAAHLPPPRARGSWFALSSRDHEQLVDEVRTDTARVLCKLCRESESHPALNSVGVHVALVVMTQWPKCEDYLKRACFRAICSMSMTINSKASSDPSAAPNQPLMSEGTVSALIAGIKAEDMNQDSPSNAADDLTVAVEAGVEVDLDMTGLDSVSVGFSALNIKLPEHSRAVAFKPAAPRHRVMVPDRTTVGTVEADRLYEHRNMAPRPRKASLDNLSPKANGSKESDHEDAEESASPNPVPPTPGRPMASPARLIISSRAPSPALGTPRSQVSMAMTDESTKQPQRRPSSDVEQKNQSDFLEGDMPPSILYHLLVESGVVRSAIAGQSSPTQGKDALSLLDKPHLHLEVESHGGSESVFTLPEWPKVGVLSRPGMHEAMQVQTVTRTPISIAPSKPNDHPWKAVGTTPSALVRAHSFFTRPEKKRRASELQVDGEPQQSDKLDIGAGTGHPDGWLGPDGKTQPAPLPFKAAIAAEEWRLVTKQATVKAYFTPGTAPRQTTRVDITTGQDVGPEGRGEPGALPHGVPVPAPLMELRNNESDRGKCYDAAVRIAQDGTWHGLHRQATAQSHHDESGTVTPASSDDEGFAGRHSALNINLDEVKIRTMGAVMAEEMSRSGAETPKPQTPLATTRPSSLLMTLTENNAASRHRQRLEATGMHSLHLHADAAPTVTLHNVKGVNSQQVIKLQKLPAPTPVVTDVYDELRGGFIPEHSSEHNPVFRADNQPVFARSAAASPVHIHRPPTDSRSGMKRLQSAPGRPRGRNLYAERFAHTNNGSLDAESSNPWAQSSQQTREEQSEFIRSKTRERWQSERKQQSVASSKDQYKWRVTKGGSLVITTDFKQRHGRDTTPTLPDLSGPKSQRPSIRVRTKSSRAVAAKPTRPSKQATGMTESARMRQRAMVSPLARRVSSRRSHRDSESTAKHALLIIDVQKDFCKGGSLAVPQGDEVVPIINSLRNCNDWDLVVLTQDWHPKDHMSFASNHQGRSAFDVIEAPDVGPQTLWPNHCVQGSDGAEFHPDLLRARGDVVVRKGTDARIDSYSGFGDQLGGKIECTPLAKILSSSGIDHVVVCGLATDYCVSFTAKDAAKHGLQVTVVEDACRGLSAANIDCERKAWSHDGIRTATSAQIRERVRSERKSAAGSQPRAKSARLPRRAPTAPVSRMTTKQWKAYNQKRLQKVRAARRKAKQRQDRTAWS